jgi:hypothetical protein
MAPRLPARSCAVLLMLAATLSVVTSARAQYFRIGLYTDSPGTECHLGSSDDGSVRVAYVVVTSANLGYFAHYLLHPSSNVAFVFSAPVPPGVVWVGDMPSVLGFDIFSGDSQSEIVVRGNTLAPLGLPPYTLLTILYRASSSLAPTPWEVKGTSYDPKPACEVLFTKYTGTSYTAWINNPGVTCTRYQYLAPHSPSPPDQWNGVPINTLLGFEGDVNRIWLSTRSFSTPRDEDIICTTAGGGSCPNPFDPGSLLPHTTYYWMAGNVCDPPSDDCQDALGDVWSFTTEDTPLAVKTSTWGAIKALYR